MRRYPWKTSKLHLERLKLFPRLRRKRFSVLVADWLHEYLARSRFNRCPSVRTNSSIVFCRQQITFRHACIPLADFLSVSPVRFFRADLHTTPRFLPFPLTVCGTLSIRWITVQPMFLDLLRNFFRDRRDSGVTVTWLVLRVVEEILEIFKEASNFL